MAGHYIINKDGQFEFREDVYDAASSLILLGYPVFPLCYKTKIPFKNSNGLDDATTDPEKIKEWFYNEDPKTPVHKNLAISLEKISVLVIDCDKGCPEEWTTKYRQEFEALGCMIAETPSGGIHYFFQLPENKSWSPGPLKIIENIDVKVGRSYIVVYPSETENGRYKWLTPLKRPEELPLPPQFLFDLLEKRKSYINKPQNNPNHIGDLSFEGSRNFDLNKYGYKLWINGEVKSEEELFDELMCVNKEYCRPLYDENSLWSMAKSIANNVQNKKAESKSENTFLPQLKLYIKPTGKSKRKVIAVWEDDNNIVWCDKFDPDCSKQRRIFINNVFTKLISKQLIQIQPENNENKELAERKFLKKLSDRLHSELIRNNEDKEEPNDQNLDEPYIKSLLALRHTDKRIIEEADEMAKNPNLLEIVYDDLTYLGLVGERNLAQICWLIGCSRLLEHPLAGVILGPTGAGKSYVLEKVAMLFPEETVLCISSATPQAWYYLPTGSLKHRFVVLGERLQSQDQETIDANKAWRELISSGKLSKMVPRRTETGEIITDIVTQPGPIAFLETTTVLKMFEEDASRLIPLFVDTSEEQTAEIVKHILNGKRENDQKKILERHFAYQRRLPLGLKFEIPFANKLLEFIPDKYIESRRLVQMLVGLLQASCLAHYLQRERRDNVLFVDAKDYIIVYKLFKQSVSYYLRKNIPKPILEIAEKLVAHFGKNEFTVSAAKKVLSISESWIRRVMSVLNMQGWAEIVEQGERGRGKAIVWRILELPEVDSILPKPEVLFK